MHIQEYMKTKKCNTLFYLSGYSFQDPSDLLQFVRKDPYDQKFHCTLCDRFSHSVITCTRNHVESKHYPDTFTYQCDLCDQIFNSKMQLNNHKQTKHKKIKNKMNWYKKNVDPTLLTTLLTQAASSKIPVSCCSLWARN